MDFLNHYLEIINNWVWGYFLIFLLVGTGIYLSFKLCFVQIRFFKHAWSLIFGKWDNPNDEGEITHFQALTTALSGTVGTGNIAGVATAITAGGPGALFWMWVTAFVGMCTKFTSCFLATKFREIDKDGVVFGGPMYYLSKGLNMPWLGFMFAIFAAIASFGIGNMVQANSVANPIFDYTGTPKWLIGSVMAVLVALVVIGGVKRIAKISSKLVPIMAFVYITGAVIVLVINVEQIPSAFSKIILSAFGFGELAGGVLGYTVSQAMRFGIARGLFSNEAGLGSAPIAHAAAKTKEPIREGVVAILEPFIDTIIICTMTGLVIIVSGTYVDTSLTGATLTSVAFDKSLPGFGKHVVSFGITLFAFSTMISWSYYGDRSVAYIFKQSKTAIFVYRCIYVLLIPIGASLSLPLIWNLADLANGLMALPNLIGLIGLSGLVAKNLKEYKKNYL